MKRAEILPPLVATVLCVSAFFIAYMPRLFEPTGFTPVLTPVAFFEPPSQDEAAFFQRHERWVEAADAWQAIAESQPDNGTAWFNLGYCLHMQGRYAEALDVHRKAATFGDYRGIATYNLGCALALTGRHDEAIQALSNAEAAGFPVREYASTDSDLDSLRNDPRFSSRYLSESQGVLGKARHLWSRARDTVAHKAPEIASDVVSLTKRTHRKVSETVDAARHTLADSRLAPLARKIPGLLPEASAEASERGASVRELMSQANTLQSEGRWLDAAATFDAVTQQDPDHAMAWFGLAYNVHMSGAYEAAIPLHKKAATFDDVRGISLYNLGCAHAMLGQTDDAISALQASANAGFDVAGFARNDTDLDSLREDARFVAMLDR